MPGTHTRVSEKPAMVSCAKWASNAWKIQKKKNRLSLCPLFLPASAGSLDSKDEWRLRGGPCHRHELLADKSSWNRD